MRPRRARAQAGGDDSWRRVDARARQDRHFYGRQGRVDRERVRQAAVVMEHTIFEDVHSHKVEAAARRHGPEDGGVIGEFRQRYVPRPEEPVLERRRVRDELAREA